MYNFRIAVAIAALSLSSVASADSLTPLDREDIEEVYQASKTICPAVFRNSGSASEYIEYESSRRGFGLLKKYLLLNFCLMYIEGKS